MKLCFITHFGNVLNRDLLLFKIAILKIVPFSGKINENCRIQFRTFWGISFEIFVKENAEKFLA